MRYNFNKHGIPMDIDVEGLHVEVDDINYMLLIFIFMVLALLLIILILDCFFLLERVLVVQKALDQLVNAILRREGKFSQFILREEPTFKCQ